AGRGLARRADHARDFGAVLHQCAREDQPALLDRADGLVGGAGDLVGELFALLGEGGEHTAAVLGENRADLFRAPGDRLRNLVGLADEVAGNLVAHSEQRAFGRAGAQADRLAGGAGEPPERLLGLRRIGADRVAELLAA